MLPRTYRLRTLGHGVGDAVRAVAFWSAIALPFSIGILLVIGSSLDVVGVLLACNVVASLVGHGYKSPADHPLSE
jgi:hypothetical protein